MSALSRSISTELASALPSTERVAVAEMLSLKGLIPVVRGFLEMELEIAVKADLDRLKTHFELPSALEESGYKTLHLGLVHMSTIGMEDARRLLDKSVDDALQYLSTPRSFLERLLAADDEVVLDDVFLHALTYFREYEYFPEVLRIWAERMRADGHTEMSKQEFSTLLRRIDRGMIAHHSFERIEELLTPLAILVGGAIPRTLLADFFRDKGMRRVAIPIGARPENAIRLRELHAILLEVHGAPERNSSELDREQMLAELRAAGVVIGSDKEANLLRQIESRGSAASQEPHTHS
jgi:hypothetical protein